MKASELIVKLAQEIAAHGDLEIRTAHTDAEPEVYHITPDCVSDEFLSIA